MTIYVNLNLKTQVKKKKFWIDPDAFADIFSEFDADCPKLLDGKVEKQIWIKFTMV